MLYSCFVVRYLNCKCFVPDVTGRPSDSSHDPLLFPVWFNPEFVCLQEFHALICSVYREKQRNKTRQGIKQNDLEEALSLLRVIYGRELCGQLTGGLSPSRSCTCWAHKKATCSGHAIHPRPEGRGFPRIFDKNHWKTREEHQFKVKDKIFSSQTVIENNNLFFLT